MTYSPKAISAGYPLFEKQYSSAERSGIAADKSGYHNSRNRLKAVTRWKNDYSIQQSRDKKGNGDAASAFDVKLNTKHLGEVTRRLIAASVARDPRLVKVVREWYASLDGNGVDGYSLWLGRPATSDPSHEWHLHISGWRDLADDEQAWLGVFEVCLGLDPGTLTDAKPKYLGPYVVDPEKVSTTLLGNAPAGAKDQERKPGDVITTGLRKDGDWLVTLDGYRFHLGYLVLKSEFDKRDKPAAVPPKPAPVVSKPKPVIPVLDPTFVKVAYVNPPGEGNWQGAIPTKDHWYLVEARKEDGRENCYVYRFPRGAEGAQVLTEVAPMKLEAEPGGKIHPTGWGCSDSGILWLTWNDKAEGNDVVTVRFQPGETVHKVETQEMRMFSEQNTQIAFDKAGEWASVRHVTTSYDTHKLRSKQDILDGKDEVLGTVKIPRKSNRTVQGFTLHTEPGGPLELRVLCGLKSTGSPFLIERWDAKTGKSLGNLRLPELGREPEGIDGDYVGFKTENRSGIDVFRYTV